MTEDLSILAVKTDQLYENQQNIYNFLYVLMYLATTAGYICLDRLLKPHFEGRYYLLHSVNNLSTVLVTYPALSYTINNLYTFYEYPFDWRATILTAALHTYHCYEYRHKLIFYDYLHHITMCFIALPLGVYVNCGSMMDFSLFFICGVPGMIDYFMMFLSRNNFVKKITQKRINNSLNLWIRCPGCISHAVLTYTAIQHVDKSVFNDFQTLISHITCVLVFWNGIYFMELVVADYAVQKYIEKCKRIV